MKNCTNLISIYRDALRCLWNHHIIQIINDESIDIDEYSLFSKFRDICESFIMSEGESIFLRITDTLDQSYILRKEVIENGNIYWSRLQDHNFIELKKYYKFLGFFDFNETSIRDLRYAVFATHGGVEYLVDFDYCSFFKRDAEASPE